MNKGRNLAIVSLAVLGGLLGYAVSITTAPTYSPWTNSGIYFYDPLTSPHLANVVMPSGRAILFQFQNGQGSPFTTASILIYNGTLYFRFDWPCAPTNPCQNAPGPSRYFVFAGTSTTPNVEWNTDQTGAGPYYPAITSSGGSYQTPLAYDWKDGALYTILMENTSNSIVSQATVNAPTSNGIYCSDYLCTPANTLSRIAEFVIVGTGVGLAIGYAIGRRQGKIG